LLTVLAFLEIARRVSMTGDKHCGTGQTAGSISRAYPDLYEASVLELQQGLDVGHFSSVDLVKVCYYLGYLHEVFL